MQKMANNTRQSSVQYKNIYQALVTFMFIRHSSWHLP